MGHFAYLLRNWRKLSLQTRHLCYDQGMPSTFDTLEDVFSQRELYRAIRKLLPAVLQADDAPPTLHLKHPVDSNEDKPSSKTDAASLLESLSLLFSAQLDNAPESSALQEPLPSTENSALAGSRALKDDVRLMGALLGLIITEHEGADFYRFIERLRQSAKDAREQSGQIGVERMHRVIQQALEGQNDTEQRNLLHRAVAAFRLFLLLAGIVEEFHQSEKFRAAPTQGLAGAIFQARNRKIDASRLKKIISKIAMRLVITAHPTKILRQTVLHHQKDIFYILQAMHAPDLTSFQQQSLLETLAEKVEVLWATQFSRWTKPEPQEEVTRVVSYLTRTLYATVPQVHQKLEQALVHYYGLKAGLPEQPLLTVGSWVGGDMDGNPYVTPTVFSDALSRQTRAILSLYITDIQETQDKLSHALHRIGITDALQASIETDLAAMRAVKADVRNFAELLGREPYRLKLTLMAAKLERTARQQSAGSNEAGVSNYASRAIPSAAKAGQTFCYHSPKELLAELDLLCDTLIAQGYKRSAHIRLDRLRQAVRIFGFHFASIDLREDTANINMTAEAILRASGVANPSLTIDALTAEILSAKALNTRHWEQASAKLPYDEKQHGLIRRMLGMLAVADQAHQTIGPEACSNLILTMTSRSEDLLCALLLLKTQGLFYSVFTPNEAVTYESHLDIVPLFETIPDLQNAATVMKPLFENAAYRQQLACRGNRQMIMVGYSDSNKDGGYFSSNWRIYKAQQELWEVATAAGIELRFFHGRGGNLGRGGGPAQRAIHALPPGTVAYGQDLTEQGEVLSRYYNVPETGLARCESLLSAIIEKNLEPETTGQTEQPAESLKAWEAVAETLSNAARQKYNSLVHENPNFIDYFEQVTPKEVELVKIGSRPSHRRAIQSVSDLRAIPWVFRWFQSRQIIPGWYGLGTALNAFIESSPETAASEKTGTLDLATPEARLVLLQTLYREWPFLESLLENSELILRQTDLSIARYYCDLSTHPDTTLPIFEDIQAEYLLTLKLIQSITGTPLLSSVEMLGLRQSIELKEPYLDPLNYIQVQLLAKYRTLSAENPDSPLLEPYHRVIVSSIEGIATGLGTSG